MSANRPRLPARSRRPRRVPSGFRRRRGASRRLAAPPAPRPPLRPLANGVRRRGPFPPRWRADEPAARAAPSPDTRSFSASTRASSSARGRRRRAARRRRPASRRGPGALTRTQTRTLVQREAARRLVVPRGRNPGPRKQRFDRRTSSRDVRAEARSPRRALSGMGVRSCRARNPSDRAQDARAAGSSTDGRRRRACRRRASARAPGRGRAREPHGAARVGRLASRRLASGLASTATQRRRARAALGRCALCPRAGVRGSTAPTSSRRRAQGPEARSEPQRPAAARTPAVAAARADRRPVEPRGRGGGGLHAPSTRRVRDRREFGISALDLPRTPRGVYDAVADRRDPGRPPVPRPGRRRRRRRRARAPREAAAHALRQRRTSTSGPAAPRPRGAPRPGRPGGGASEPATRPSRAGGTDGLLGREDVDDDYDDDDDDDLLAARRQRPRRGLPEAVPRGLLSA